MQLLHNKHFRIVSCIQRVLWKYLICLITHVMGTPLSCPFPNAHLLSLCFSANLATITNTQGEGGLFIWIYRQIWADFQGEANEIIHRYLPLPFLMPVSPQGMHMNEVFEHGFYSPISAGSWCDALLHAHPRTWRVLWVFLYTEISE